MSAPPCIPPPPVRPGKPLTHQALLGLLGNIAYAACQWSVIVFIARLGTPTDVGTYSLCLSIIAPIFMFCSLSLRTAQATDQRGAHSYHTYATIRKQTTSIALACAAILSFLLDLDPSTRILLLILAIFKSVDQISDLFQGRYQQLHRVDIGGYSRIVSSTVQIVAFIAVLAAGCTTPVAVLAMACGYTLSLLMFDLPRMRRLHSTIQHQPRTASYARIAASLVPLAIAGTIDTLAQTTPRYFLDYYSGRHSLGVFSAIYYLMIPHSMIVVSIADAVRPRLAQLFSTSPQHYRALLCRLARVIAVGSTIPVVVSALFGSDILTIVYGSEYASYQTPLILAMASAGIWGLAGVATTGLAATRNFRSLLISYVIMFVTLLIILPPLTLHFNISGCIVSFGISMAVRGLTSYFLLTRQLQLQSPT